MLNLRSLPLCALAGALLVSTALTAQEAAPAVRILNPVDETQLVTLKGTVHPLANAANDRGAAPESMQLDRMHLVLKRSAAQEAALKQLIGEMHTPGSANYHKWLTPDQFGKQFGPSDQDLATVQTWLAGQGFNVVKVNPGKQTIEISGSVAQMRTAFHTQVHKYSVNGETHYANANDPQIPAALAPVVGGFASLNNFRLKSYARKLGKASYDPKTDRARPEWTIGSGTVNPQNYNFVLSPADYAVQYDLNPLYTAGITGTGQTIAIVNESNINIDLVNQFRTLFGLSANPPQVVIDGSDPGIDGINNPGGPNYASVEAYLDVEWAGAVAPNATVDLVIAADTALSNGLQLAAEHAVYSNIAPVISLSFGNCEAGLGSYNQFLNGLWEQAAAQGITVLVSTGDAGSAGCDNDNSQAFAVDGQAVNGFASTPYNVAVGGTDFYYSQYNGSSTALDAQLATYWNTTASNSTPAKSILGYIPEQPWNESQYGLNILNYYNLAGYTSIAGGGGGASNNALCSSNTYSSSTGLCTGVASGYAKPAWQSALTPSDGVRDLPDVSLFASSGINDSYYPICATDGDCTQVNNGYAQIYGVGGTSASTPAFAGIMALVNQKYGRQGQANTVLYPLKAQYPAAFHDVTVGTISMPCEYAPSRTANCISVTSPIVYGSVTEGQIGNTTTNIPEYNAAAGYNLATGLGTIDAANLVNNWSKVALAATSTTLSPSSASFTHGTAVTIAGTVTAGSGTPTGNVALLTDSSEASQQGQNVFTLSGGSYSGSVSTLPGGTYNIWGQYGGDSANGQSSSAKTSITVAPESSGIDFNIFSGNYYFTASNTPGSQVDYGSQLMLSAIVAPTAQLSTVQNCVINGCTTFPSFTTPTGTVTFTDNGSTTLNTAVVNAEGDAEYNAPFTVGSHSVTATYNGDKSYNTASASAIAFKVVKDTPEFFWGASNATSSSQIINGQPTVFNVIVENYAQYAAATSSAIYPVSVLPPTGTVVLTSSPSGISGTATLSAGVDPSDGAQAGVGTITLPSTLGAGTYNVTFTYSGDANYNSEQAGGSIQVVSTSGLATTTAATTSGGISPNSTITITGTVTGQSGHAAPTGGVILFSSGNNIGEVAFSSSTGVVSSFSMTLNSQTLFQGANFVTLQYTGDATYAPSAVTLNSGNSIANPLADFTLLPQATTVPISVASGANTGTDTINLASVNTFSGTVNLSCKADPGVTCSISSTAGLSSGGAATATLTVSAPADTANKTYNILITGKDAATGLFIHTLGIQAVVTGSPAGSSSFALSNSGNLTLDAGINTGNTSTITVTPLGSFSSTVALSCAVTPTGSNSPACSLASPSVASGSGTDLLTVTTTASTPAGTYTVTVTGTSGIITMTTAVTASVGTPSFALSNSGTVTIATTGQTGSATITVTPANGFTGTVSLSCLVTGPSGANDPATCSIPGSVTVSGTTAQTATLTVYTTAATALNHPMKLFWPSTGGAVLALAFFFVPRRRRNWLAMLGLLVLFVSVAGMGCGGGGSSGGGGISSNPGTTIGTYTVTVTGTSGSITQTTAVTVNVQ